MAPLRVELKPKAKTPTSFALPDLFLNAEPRPAVVMTDEPERIEATSGGPMLQSSLRGWLKSAARDTSARAAQTKRKAEAAESSSPQARRVEEASEAKEATDAK